MTAGSRTVLAFDYGERRIGVAMGNLMLREARALTVVANLNREVRFAEMGKLIAEWQPELIVVGLPCHPDGTPHEMTQQAKRFGNQLNGRFSVPVVWVDERYSSVAAAAALAEAGVKVSQKTSLDAEAARIILQQYFDEHVPA
ncbi:MULTISPECIES: Holliday junction resolvase RuvX [Pandoraea]|uniref:Putative pre-16S rRNA nuclease n=1 Tax=Pandoraea capi TaxID=2508286 RepID=A0ABY6VW03_9BURK|nr:MULTISPECIES: Holliday junction resolvase RuvX [Pandoraea]MCI3203705.1 Holliday junction resolvase RuvX [Pandoraea sp. LA3]MDN4581731.1 Holliday junction resolvase RuvX [Pandoraea capi]VVD69410.1 Holliday junction DNA helicase RuvA [Pandoraea capi]